MEHMMKTSKSYIKDTIVSYLFMSPSMIIFIWFMVIPIFMSFYISLNDWNILSGVKWNAGRNYINILSDKVFIKSLINTLYFSALTVIPTAVLSLLVALLINSKLIKYKEFFKGVLFIPVVASMVIASLVWKWIFHGDVGLLNYFIGLFGIKPVLWLSTIQYAMLAVSIMSVWKSVGYYMVLYLAGLTGIPDSLYEAAKVDGGTKWDIFIKITIPMLKPTILLVLVMATINSFQVFDAIYVMTYGGPANATNTLVWFIYQQGFVRYQMGYGATAGFFLFLIVFIVSVFELKLLKSDTMY